MSALSLGTRPCGPLAHERTCRWTNSPGRPHRFLFVGLLAYGLGGPVRSHVLPGSDVGGSGSSPRSMVTRRGFVTCPPARSSFLVFPRAGRGLARLLLVSHLILLSCSRNNRLVILPRACALPTPARCDRTVCEAARSHYHPSMVTVISAPVVMTFTARLWSLAFVGERRDPPQSAEGPVPFCISGLDGSDGGRLDTIWAVSTETRTSLRRCPIRLNGSSAHACPPLLAAPVPLPLSVWLRRQPLGVWSAVEDSRWISAPVEEPTLRHPAPSSFVSSVPSVSPIPARLH